MGWSTTRSAERSSLVKSIPKTEKARVLVVGDVMLDRYWYGDASRISPEAPVPVLLFREEEFRLGGAANVAANCAALGAQTRLLSVVGRDAAGATLAKMLNRKRVKADLHREARLRTTEKLRVIGRRQQLLRIDREVAPSTELLASRLPAFRAALRECDVVLLSDYGKGGLAHIASMIRDARRAGKAVLVDPKGNEYSRYKGATLLTPNLKELADVVGEWTGEAELARKAHALREKLGLEALLLTRGEQGMTLFKKARRTVHVKAEKREVSDVTGAGDTVIATLAVMIAAGEKLEAAVRLANRAGGIKVTKFGTAEVTRAELFA
ncbi:MAG: D-glycero-beta-D-manno-heptose-7-phosphate kinase [Betaproteobacteria bacterium]|nr:D-glycero-beta-D-manno-heptose-7-phosphate kinase [Betaproteobacteria bacterium]